MNKVKNMLGRVGRYSPVALLGAVVAHAQTTPTDYGATLNTNLTTINTIWGTVATIIIAVALVSVGTRFFKKAK